MERMIEINTIVICLVCAEGECEMEEGRGREEGKESTLEKMDERESPAGSCGMKAARAGFPRTKERETFVWILMTDICG